MLPAEPLWCSPCRKIRVNRCLEHFVLQSCGCGDVGQVESALVHKACCSRSPRTAALCFGDVSLASPSAFVASNADSDSTTKQKFENAGILARLPTELIVAILMQLPSGIDVVRFSETSRRMNAVVRLHGEVIFAPICRRRGLWPAPSSAPSLVRLPSSWVALYKRQFRRQQKFRFAGMLKGTSAANAPHNENDRAHDNAQASADNHDTNNADSNDSDDDMLLDNLGQAVPMIPIDWAAMLEDEWSM